MQKRKREGTSTRQATAAETQARGTERTFDRRQYKLEGELELQGNDGEWAAARGHEAVGVPQWYDCRCKVEVAAHF